MITTDRKLDEERKAIEAQIAEAADKRSVLSMILARPISTPKWCAS